MTAPAPKPGSGWLIVAGQELRDLWLSARGPSVLFVFSLLLSILAYLAATTKDLNITDQKDTVNLIVQVTLGIGVAAALLFSADAISGERERETLETLLLTPVSRRQIVIGKLIAAISIWPPLLAVAIPSIWVLGRGVGVWGNATLVALGVGTLLALAFASLGMVVSIFSNSNRFSLAASFFLYIAFLVPTQLSLAGWFGEAVKRGNPATAGGEYMRRIIVQGHGITEDWTWLWSTGAAAIVGIVVVFVIASRLELRGGFRR